MYVEADTNGRVVIQDMSTEQAEWVQNALLSSVENHYKGTPAESVLRRAAMDIDRVRRPEPKPSVEPSSPKRDANPKSSEMISTPCSGQFCPCKQTCQRYLIGVDTPRDKKNPPRYDHSRGQCLDRIGVDELQNKQINKMRITPNFECITGSFDTVTTKMECVVKRKYLSVELCVKPSNDNWSNIPVAKIKLSGDTVGETAPVYEEMCALGREIARRWNECETKE